MRKPNRENINEVLSLLSRHDVAQKLGVSLSTVDRLRRESSLRALTIRRRVKFRKEDVEAFIDGQKGGGGFGYDGPEEPIPF